MELIIKWIILIVGIIVVLMVAFVLLRKYILQKKIERDEKVKKAIYEEIEDKLFSLAPEEFKNHFSDPKQRRYIYDILKKLVLENGYDFHGIFDEMGFTKEAMMKIERNADRQALKDLSIIKSPTSYEYLIQLLQSDDIELSYRAGYALSYISLEPEQKREVIELLLYSDITTARVIEIIVIMEPSLNLLLEILDKQFSDRGKIILLNAMRERVIGNTGRFKFLKKKLRFQNKAVIEQLQNYLKDDKDVTIACVHVLSDTKQLEAQELIVRTASERTESEVLAAIANCLAKFPPNNSTLDLLYRLAQHENYWVRLASFESLAKLGEDGYRKIFELSMNSSFLSRYPSTYYLIYQLISEIPEMPTLMEKFKQEQNKDFSRVLHAS